MSLAQQLDGSLILAPTSEHECLRHEGVWYCEVDAASLDILKPLVHQPESLIETR